MQISVLHIWKSVQFWQFPSYSLLHKCASYFYKATKIIQFLDRGKRHNCITFSLTTKGTDGNRTCQSTRLLKITPTVPLRDCEYIGRKDSDDTNLCSHCLNNYKGI